MTGSASPRRGIFVATILVGSFLLFLIQPMLARMVLPKLGGAPAVWNSAMLVYQALLLGGYAYAHWLGRFAIRRQAVVHMGLLLVAALWLPIGITAIGPPPPGQEALWVPWLLLASIGPIFFAISAQAPLMQRWFAADSRAGDPYYLYAASNLGSFAGLISYPLWVEPNVTLASQSWGWTLSYGLLCLLVLASAAARWRQDAAVVGAAAGDGVGGMAAPKPQDEARPSLRRQFHWVALAAVPSGLVLSTTTHLTTDIVAMPLLWVLPLGLYLLSFVIAFVEKNWLKALITTMAPAALLAIGGLSLIHSGGSMMLALASLILLFFLSVSLHGYLHHLRPSPQYLTLFYLLMSAGGVLGGLFSALVAPLLFDWVYEHPLLILAAGLLLPLPLLLPWPSWLGLGQRGARLLLLLLVAVSAVLAVQNAAEWRGLFEDAIIWRTGLLFLIGLFAIAWRPAFVALLLLLMLGLGGKMMVEESLMGDRTRSYFGVYAITDDPAVHQRRLAHGTTLHGLQRSDPGYELEPTTYYGRSSGVGMALERAEELAGPRAHVAVVGLGAGTLACYRQPGQSWTFYEIDPAMEAIARDPARFTFLADCAADAPVILGDARLMLEQGPAAQYDMVVIDAFSSDAVPLHLLTREAMDIYARALKPDGLLLIHISNRFFDLQPVLKTEAAARGWQAALRDDEPFDTLDHLKGSSWVALSPSSEKLAKLTGDVAEGATWVPLRGRQGFQRWTDDYASTLPILIWHNILGKQE
ncbi:MAG TPA: fused MFS/spermidine synthase [Sphingopyxis sp.]|nr:fused MFS/spermidine synthase [Sphingopyxis sp.]